MQYHYNSFHLASNETRYIFSLHKLCVDIQGWKTYDDSPAVFLKVVWMRRECSWPCRVGGIGLRQRDIGFIKLTINDILPKNTGRKFYERRRKLIIV